MRLKRAVAVFMLATMMISCGSDDDICLSGEATPRMKLKFKTKSTGNQRTLDSIFVKIDYGQGQVSVIENRVKTDSLLIPLRVDNHPFTQMFVSTDSSPGASVSTITINYTTNSFYVSPACGFAINYQDISATVDSANPVLDIEKNQNEINDEDKTHFFLLF